MAQSHRATVIVGLFALATIIPLLRQRGARPWDTIQSDDGTGFLVPAWHHSPLSLLWTSYGGYLNLAPRLAAAPLAVVPPGWGAAYLAVTSAVITALLAWFVAANARGLVRQTALRWLLAVMVVAAPIAGHETTGVLSQLQFPLLFAAFWAVISVRRSRTLVAARAAVVFLACTSSALAFAFVPLAVVVWAYRRTRADATVAIALVVGALLQGIVLLRTPTPPPVGARTLGGLPAIYAQRVVASWLVGDTQLRGAWLGLGSILLMFAVLAAFAVVVVLGWRVRGSQWFWVASAFASSAVVLVGSLWFRGLVPALGAQEGFFSSNGARYVLAPFWLFFSALVLLAGAPQTDGTPSWTLARGMRVLLVTQAVVLVAVSFRVTSLRSNGPSYAGQLRAARQQCARHPEARPYLLFSPPQFNAPVHCEDV